MESLYPIFVKKVVDFTTPWITIVNTAKSYYFLTTGNVGETTTVTGTCVTNGILGPIDISGKNGGADVLELVGYYALATTSGTAVTTCKVSVNAWGETSGMNAYKGIIGVSGTPTFTTNITELNHAKNIGGMTALTVMGGNSNGANTGKSSKGGIHGVPVADSFPFIAGRTVTPTSGDIAQLSVWITGPGSDADANGVISGSPLSLLPIDRVWLSVRFDFDNGATSITTPANSGGGLALVGYRSCTREDPKEHNIVGCKPVIVSIA